MKELLIAFGPVVFWILLSLGASECNDKIRKHKEAGVQSPRWLVLLAGLLNFVAANKDKVQQLMRDGGAPDGRLPRQLAEPPTPPAPTP